MRKTFVLLVLPLFVMSCQKQYCWECDIATAGGLTYKEQICDRTKKQIKNMQENPLETKDNTGAVKYITTFSNCVRR